MTAFSGYVMKRLTVPSGFSTGLWWMVYRGVAPIPTPPVVSLPASSRLLVDMTVLSVRVSPPSYADHPVPVSLLYSAVTAFSGASLF
jgi:hypothetical protein